MKEVVKTSVLGEAKILTKFVEDGYDVFTQFSGKEPFDLAVHKDGKIYRVSIKSTSYKRKYSYEVPLKRTRSNKTVNKIHNFDPDECDILAVYIIPEDMILLVDPKKCGKTCLNINMNNPNRVEWRE